MSKEKKRSMTAFEQLFVVVLIILTLLFATDHLKFNDPSDDFAEALGRSFVRSFGK